MAIATTTQLIISSVSELLYSGDVTSVTVPGVEGEMTLLAHHESLITVLKQGTITVRTAATPITTFEITSGFLETSNNKIIILI